MAIKKINFVHISDIHFMKGFSGKSSFDIDSQVRNAILNDAKNKSLKCLAPIYGILITGDIAFSGKSEEYKIALDWLTELCKKLNCNPGHVWCVPGNHDVDRAVHKEFTTIPATHEQLLRAQEESQECLDEKLCEHLENQNTGPVLFAPLKAYNEEFGQRFDCITTPKKPWWEDDVILNDNSVLRIRGLNSVLVSGPRDDIKGNKLLLGTAQTEYGKYDGIQYLTICHHPVSSLYDEDVTEEALLAYSQIQLFGHKHYQRVREINNTLWLCAGAVHPIRKEKKWQPRYNYLSIWVDGTGKDRYLCVDVYSRIWNQDEKEFTHEQTSGSSDFKPYRLKLPEWTNTMVEPKKKKSAKNSILSTEPPVSKLAFDRKELIYHFIGLPDYIRKAIMKKHGLIEDDDKTRTDAEIFSKCFERARAKGVLEALWVSIKEVTN
jgi:predicted phosphodiesterase/DNA-binding Xre family transcriptional regulator